MIFMRLPRATVGHSLSFVARHMLARRLKAVFANFLIVPPERNVAHCATLLPGLYLRADLLSGHGRQRSRHLSLPLVLRFGIAGGGRVRRLVFPGELDT